MAFGFVGDAMFGTFLIVRNEWHFSHLFYPTSEMWHKAKDLLSSYHMVSEVRPNYAIFSHRSQSNL
jgi:hypothetical protein